MPNAVQALSGSQPIERWSGANPHESVCAQPFVRPAGKANSDCMFSGFPHICPLPAEKNGFSRTALSCRA